VAFGETLGDRLEGCGWTFYAPVILVGFVLPLVVNRIDRSSDGYDGATTVSNAAAARQAILSSTIDVVAGYTARLPITSQQKTASFARS